MTKNTPNQIVNLQNKFILLQNTIFLNLKRVLFIVITFCSITISAQVANSYPDTNEVYSYLSSLKTTSTSNYQNLDGLIHNLNPAIYINDKTLKTYGENCTVLYSDITSLNTIKNNTITLNSIEMVQINITKTTDLSGEIDFSIFSNFPNLKYIYLFSSIQSNENNFKQMFRNYDSKYTLIYSINLGE